MCQCEKCGDRIEKAYARADRLTAEIDSLREELSHSRMHIKELERGLGEAQAEISRARQQRDRLRAIILKDDTEKSSGPPVTGMIYTSGEFTDKLLTLNMRNAGIG